MQVAETFLTDLGDGKGPLQDVARLDTCVTVVDATEMHRHLQGFKSRTIAVDDDAGRDIAQLMTEQVEFANVIVLNKIDRLADKVAIDDAVALLRAINPTARIVPTVNSAVPSLSDVVRTNLFTPEFAESVNGWMEQPQEQHNPETLEYGVSSVSLRADRPFHPGRLHAWMVRHWTLRQVPEEEEDEQDATDVDSAVCALAPEVAPEVAPEEYVRRRTEHYGGDVFRVKGFVWLGNPSRKDYFMVVSAAGRTMNFVPGAGWEEFPTRGKTDTEAVAPHQRIVLIGQNLNKERVLADLSALLLTADEHQELQRAIQAVPEGVTAPADVFDDPFTHFVYAESDDDDDEDSEWDDEEVVSAGARRGRGRERVAARKTRKTAKSQRTKGRKAPTKPKEIKV
jgi:G3E family GTPase